LDLGSRQGQLKKGDVASWSPGDAPGFVEDAMREFTLPDLHEGA
jgi:hypothetical protein